MSAPQKKTRNDLLALGDDVRAELINGEIVWKSDPADALPSVRHARTEGLLMLWAGRRFHRNPGGRWPGGWWIQPEIHVVYDSQTVFCHDLAGWRRETLPELPDGWMEQRPDWVCEILSPTKHAKRDLVDKLEMLFAHGVRDYWVIDHEKKILLLHRQAAGGYIVQPVRAGETIRAAPFEAVELRTGILFGDEDDEE